MNAALLSLQQQLETLTKQKQELEQLHAELMTLNDEAERREPQQADADRHTLLHLSHGATFSRLICSVWKVKGLYNSMVNPSQSYEASPAI